MPTRNASVLICGGGIVGLAIARDLLTRGAEDIILLEKEDAIGKHASGRNSGVLHAGIYYPAGSLKAKLCLKGNLLLKEYCKEKGLPVLETGKVVVAKHERELDTLRTLYQTALTNGAKVELIDELALAEIEPYAKTHQQALYSHFTAIVDPHAILHSLAHDLLSSGKVKILTNTRFVRLEKGRTVLTSQGPIQFGLFINAAGAYSDRIAHAFGVGRQYRLIPFKGTYKKLRPDRAFLVRGNIYPVPDLRNPFLGLHFTRSVTGEVYIGPTAIPAFGREHYSLLSGMTVECLRIFYQDLILFLCNPRFRAVALSEPRKYFPAFFFQDARSLVKELHPTDIEPCKKVGIRPQLVDWDRKELVMDFLVLKDQESVHILNAISPAFTSSLAFAEHIVEHFCLRHGRLS